MHVQRCHFERDKTGVWANILVHSGLELLYLFIFVIAFFVCLPSPCFRFFSVSRAKGGTLYVMKGLTFGYFTDVVSP